MYRMSELRAARHGTSHRVSDAYERLHRISELLAAGYDVTGSDAPPVLLRGPREKSAALRTVERLVKETGAGALVAPHFYGAGVLGNYKQQNPEAFAAAVLTDYVPHPIGIPPNLDLYVVADDAAADEVEKLGAPPAASIRRAYP
jgi:sirohydrochlorin ferrochelatase